MSDIQEAQATSAADDRMTTLSTEERERVLEILQEWREKEGRRPIEV